MQLKTWTLSKTHQAQASSHGGFREKRRKKKERQNTVTHKYTKYSNCILVIRE